MPEQMCKEVESSSQKGRIVNTVNSVTSMCNHINRLSGLIKFYWVINYRDAESISPKVDKNNPLMRV